MRSLAVVELRQGPFLNCDTLGPLKVELWTSKGTKPGHIKIILGHLLAGGTRIALVHMWTWLLDDNSGGDDFGLSHKFYLWIVPQRNEK
jgi:hypothetical protein